MSERKAKNALREALASPGLPANGSGQGCDVSTTGAQQKQPLIAMTTLNSRLKLALLNRKKGRNLIEKGFTLVELMIVIVIVGVLSAAAIPQFLGLKDRAVAGSLIGSMSGFAKECATGQITSTAALITPTKLASAGITTNLQGAVEADGSGNGAQDAISCDGTEPITFSNSTAFVAEKITGVVCAKDDDGADAKATGIETTCTITVAADGTITGEWGPT